MVFWIVSVYVKEVKSGRQGEGGLDQRGGSRVSTPARQMWPWGKVEMLLQCVGWSGTSGMGVTLKCGGDATPVCRVARHQRGGCDPEAWRRCYSSVSGGPAPARWIWPWGMVVMLLQSVGWPGTSEAEVSLKHCGDTTTVCQVVRHQRGGYDPEVWRKYFKKLGQCTLNMRLNPHAPRKAR